MSAWLPWPARLRSRRSTAEAAADRRLDALLDRALVPLSEASEACVLAALADLPAQERRRRWAFPPLSPVSAPGRAAWPALAGMAMASVVGLTIGISDIGSPLGGDAEYSLLDETPTLTAALEP